MTKTYFPHSPGDVKCVLRISTTTAADTDIETWYHLWEAMVALNAMCARVGKRGVASRLGRLSPMFFSPLFLFLLLLRYLYLLYTCRYVSIFAACAKTANSLSVRRAQASHAQNLRSAVFVMIGGTCRGSSTSQVGFESVRARYLFNQAARKDPQSGSKVKTQAQVCAQ